MFVGNLTQQVTTLLNTRQRDLLSHFAAYIRGDQLLGTTSAPQTVTLTNSGTTPMTISSVVSSGPPFRMTANTCGGSLAPSAQCSITADFTAQVKGTVSGGITINVAPRQPQFVELLGIGTELAIKPVKLAFPPQKVGTQSSPPRGSSHQRRQNEHGVSHTSSTSATAAFPQFSQTNDCGAFLPPEEAAPSPSHLSRSAPVRSKTT